MRLRLIFYVLCFALLTRMASADDSISFIRDQEVEDVLISYIKPLFKASGLNPDTLQIHLIKDNSINAFAAKGSNIFIHTGLITQASAADEIIGVLAHETGHIADGHLARLYDNMKIARRNTIISTLLGAGAAIATGRADVGMAVMMGGSDAALQGHLAYRRSEENAADQTATQILDKTGYSASGFLNMMQKIYAQEKISMSQDASSYLRTHPLSGDRVAFLQNYVAHENISAPDPTRKNNEATFQRIKAKLLAFLGTPTRILTLYNDTNRSIPYRYARSIAYFRLGEVEKASAEINSLIKDFPSDAYFHELKAQILFENGRIAEAIPAYGKAVSLEPEGSLLQIEYASALLEDGSKENTTLAIKALEKVLRVEKDNPSVWRLLAIAYGKQADDALTSYAMAEYMFGIGDYKMALVHAKKALNLLPKGGAKHIRMLDLEAEAERLLKEEKDKE